MTLRELRELLLGVGGELAAARELVLAGEGSDRVEVARTLADLAHADTISAAAVAESLRYRPADDRSAGISPGAD